MATNDGKFVCYYRVSTGGQGKSGLGLDAQRAAVATYLNGGSWQIVDEFTEVESGKRPDRPALDKALAAARLHRASLVVSKVDRLTRSVAFLSRLLEAGVDVRFADLPQIEGATGRFLLQQMVAVAELEAGMISARTKAALAAAKKRGKKLGGNRGVKPTEEMRARSAAFLQLRADAKVGAAEAGRRARRRSGAFRPGKILPLVRSALYSFGLLKWGICRFGRVGGRADRKYGLTVEPFLGQIRSYSPDAKAACENADRVAVTTYSSLFNTNPFFDDRRTRRFSRR